MSLFEIHVMLVFVVFLFTIFFFFFSSRRRHTRCLSDWSSDVCSSDLALRSPPASRFDAERRPSRGRRICCPTTNAHPSAQARSEERRVGKECRSRGSPYRKKKKRGNGVRAKYEGGHSRRRYEHVQ